MDAGSVRSTPGSVLRPTLMTSCLPSSAPTAADPTAPLELGEALGVSRQTVNSIETGRYDPSLPLAIAIARHFHQSVEEIFHVDQ